MLAGKKTGLVMALGIEAGPFVRGFGMETIETRPFVLYRKDNLFLIKAGVGRVRAASAAVHLINTCAPDVLVNAGTAGANCSSVKTGSVYNVKQVFDRDMPSPDGKGHVSYHVESDPECPSASLVTSDRPAVSDAERADAARIAQMSDMEGASFAFTAARFSLEAYIYKIVSDSSGVDSREELMKNIKKYSEDLFLFFRERFWEK